MEYLFRSILIILSFIFFHCSAEKTNDSSSSLLFSLSNTGSATSSSSSNNSSTATTQQTPVTVGSAPPELPGHGMPVLPPPSGSAGANCGIGAASPGWQQQALIKAANASANAQYGAIIASSGDTIVVGHPGDKSNQRTITNGPTASNDQSGGGGAVYVYKLSAGVWTQEAYIKPSNLDENDDFGRSVSISGDILVVGAPGEASLQNTISTGTTASIDNSANDAGAVYVFRRSGSNWNQIAYIKASNNRGPYHRFGQSVAIVGNTLAVGAREEPSGSNQIINGTGAPEDYNGMFSGAVYIYQWDGNLTWTQEAFIKASNNRNGGFSDETLWSTIDLFGGKIALSEDGNKLAVGAIGEDSGFNGIVNGSGGNSDNSIKNAGAVYIYKRTGNQWAEEAYIKAPNPGTSHWFGEQLSISGDRLAVSASEGSNFRGISNTTNNDNSSLNSGAVYTYIRTGANWTFDRYIKSSNSDPQDRFGSSVVISGNRLLVGASRESSNINTVSNAGVASADNSFNMSGAAYVFTNSGGVWSQSAYLKPSNVRAGRSFGFSAAMNNDRIIIGSVGESSNANTITHGLNSSCDITLQNSGAIYVFGNVP
ncbi:MAG: hypothetical protein SH817_04445 [Leptospira sp.]|mgnify:CR=1 FL=1|nr:hypothetical protein [Leptospira sp.]